MSGAEGGEFASGTQGRDHRLFCRTAHLESGAEAHAVQTLRALRACFPPREAFGLRALQRRFSANASPPFRSRRRETRPHSCSFVSIRGSLSGKPKRPANADGRLAARCARVIARGGWRVYTSGSHPVEIGWKTPLPGFRSFGTRSCLLALSSQSQENVAPGVGGDARADRRQRALGDAHALVERLAGADALDQVDVLLVHAVRRSGPRSCQIFSPLWPVMRPEQSLVPLVPTIFSPPRPAAGAVAAEAECSARRWHTRTRRRRGPRCRRCTSPSPPRCRVEVLADFLRIRAVVAAWRARPRR